MAIGEPARLPLDINAASEIQEAEKPVLNTPEEEKELKSLLNNLAKAKKARREYDQNWPKYEAYYNGNQWYGKKRSSYRATPNANIIRPTVQTVIPIMTDTQPGIDVLPQEPRDYWFSEILSKVNRSWWNRSSMPLTIVEVLTDCSIYDAGFLKVVWSPDLDGGRGDVEIVTIDPKNLYVLENSNDINKNCPVLIELYPATVGELKRKYPDKADKIRASDRPTDTSDNTQNTEIYLVSPTDKDDGHENPILHGGGNENDIVWCAEMWMDDYAVEEEDTGELNEDGTPKIEERRKYPLGKVVQAVPGLNLVLDVGPNPYSDGRKPYVRFINTVRPRKFYGEGEVGPLCETQDMINRTLATIYDHTTLMVNAVWIIDDNSNVDPELITNQVGLVIQKAPGSEVKREQPPPISAQLFEFYNQNRALADTQSGVHDVTQGRKPTGITAAEAISTMQEAAQTRIRLKERNMQVALQQLGYLVVSRFLQFYRSPRVIKITGQNQWPEFFEFFIEQNPGSGNYVLNSREYEYNEEMQKYRPGNWQTSEETKGLFDIEVVAGTALPFMKSQRGELAIRLQQQGIIDDIAVLETLEWPDKEKVIQRKQEAAAAKAAAQQGAPLPPPPPPMG